MDRVSEVIDCWVESASMPFAELHFPFENKSLFKKRFPADFIAEYISQTRTWFYYMHAASVLLFKSISFKNVVSTGTILNEKGEKLSKSKRNFTDPQIIIDKYGADPLRFYLMSSIVMQGEDLFFSDQEVKETYNKVVNTFLNVAEFYSMYGEKSAEEGTDSKNILDRWILSRLETLKENNSEFMDKFDTIRACREIKIFIEDLSVWYLRRSRERLKGEGAGRLEASKTLRHVIISLSKILAPITPFLAEVAYQNLAGENESVHLSGWPEPKKNLKDRKLEEEMEIVRNLVASALANRAKASIKVRQPLKTMRVKTAGKIGDELIGLIKDEVNVKEVIFDKNIESETELDLEISEDLKEEGMAREIVRAINDLRKKQGLTPDDRIISATDYPLKEKYKELVRKETRSVSLENISGEGWIAAQIGEYRVGIKKTN